jgi:integrase
MLSIYRRHLAGCPHKDKGSKWKNCKCPIWVTGRLPKGNYIKKSLNIVSWEGAQFRVREMETDDLLPVPIEQPKTTIKSAVEKFTQDAKARHLTPATLSKFRVLLETQLLEFAKDKGLQFIQEFDPDAVRDFRAGWKDSPISALKKFERLRSFFRFCHESGWLPRNPAATVKPPKVKPTPTLPYTPEEMEKLLWACELFSTMGRYRADNRKRVRAMVLLLRFSGLRIADAVTLKRDRINDGKLFLYTQKTGTPVYLPLPKRVLDALEQLSDYTNRFFWNGQGKVTSVVSVWERTLKRLFEIAHIEGGHAHRFRDTFAVELLKQGVPLESVAVLLGHSSVKITEKHYSPWVQARQIQLEEMVKRAWA